MSKNIDFHNQYTFDQLSAALLNEQLSIDEWVTIFARLYPRTDSQTTTKNISFFAKSINQYRHSRMITERSAKTGTTVVMIAGLVWLEELAVTSTIGYASLTLYILDAALTFFTPIIFNPKIGFPEGKVKLTPEQKEEWQTYRTSWLRTVEEAQLSKENQQKQVLTRTLGVGLVLTFAAGLVLTTHVMSVNIVAHLMAYVLGLGLSPNNQQLVEGYAKAPDTEFKYDSSPIPTVEVAEM